MNIVVDTELMEIVYDTILTFDPSSELPITLIDETYPIVVLLESETKLDSYTLFHVEKRVIKL